MDKIKSIIGPATKAFVAAVLPILTVAVADLFDAVSAASSTWVTTVIVSVLTAAGVYAAPNTTPAE